MCHEFLPSHFGVTVLGKDFHLIMCRVKQLTSYQNILLCRQVSLQSGALPPSLAPLLQVGPAETSGQLTAVVIKVLMAEEEAFFFSSPLFSSPPMVYFSL